MKKLATIICISLFSMTAHAALPGGVVYVAAPVPQHVVEGGRVEVELRGKDFSVPLDGGGLNVSFDSARLHLISVDAAPAWRDFFSAGSHQDPGEIQGIYFNTMSMDGVGGDFSILTLSFEAMAGGLAHIALLANTTFPFGRLGEQLVPQFEGRDVAIVATAAPEPTTWVMIFIGSLLSLAARRWQLMNSRTGAGA